MIRGKGALSLNSIADVWTIVLDRLRSQLSETTINTWFDEVEAVTMEDSAFVLHCSNTFKRSTIETRFMTHIKAALKDIFSSDLEVKILDDQQLSAYHGVAPDRPGSLLESDAFTFNTYVVGPQNRMAYAAARAVAQLNVLCELALPLVKVGGQFLAMKSVDTDDEIQRARSAIAQLGGKIGKIWDYTIPGTDVRHRMVIIRKERPTPAAYPRPFARIKKAPLG